MNNQFYTSLKLSKALAEAGCNLEAFRYWNHVDCIAVDPELSDERREGCIKSYYLLEDICCTYAKNFWGEYRDIETGEYEYERASENILYLLHQNKKQEVEDYIRQHSIIFNKNNDDQ